MTDVYEAAKIAQKALDDKHGQDIHTIDLRGISSLTDFFIITNGNNEPHVKTLADEVQSALTQAGLTMRSLEGYAESSWILLDFGDIIIHVFDKTTREFYNLERIWSDAPMAL